MTVTRYLIKTARGYFRSEKSRVSGSDTFWTSYPEDAEEWVDLEQCHKACRQYTSSSGESAVVVVHLRPSATSGTAVPVSV